MTWRRFLSIALKLPFFGFIIVIQSDSMMMAIAVFVSSGGRIKQIENEKKNCTIKKKPSQVCDKNLRPISCQFIALTRLKHFPSSFICRFYLSWNLSESRVEYLWTSVLKKEEGKVDFDSKTQLNTDAGWRSEKFYHIFLLSNFYLNKKLIFYSAWTFTRIDHSTVQLFPLTFNGVFMILYIQVVRNLIICFSFKQLLITTHDTGNNLW